MPDNSNTSELFARIREQLAAIGKPGGVPLHPQIKDILQVIADFLQTVEVINTDNEQQDEEQNQAIAALQALIADLKLSLQQNTAADEADRARLTADEAALTALEEQVNAWETEINNRINAAIQPVVSGLDDAKQQLLADQARITQIEADLSALLSQIGVLPPGTTVAETLNQISVAIEGLKSGVAALQEQDRIDDDRIKSILDQIAALDQKIKDLPPAGLSETEVQTLVDGMLQTLRDSITALQQQDTTDDGRIKSILDQIAALEEKINNLPTGGGLSEAAVKALIEAALQTLRDSITALQQQDTTDDGRIKSILAQIAALEEKINNLPTGGGLSEAAVKALIEAALQTLRDSITALQQQDTTDDGRIKSILDQIAALEEKINNLPTGGGLSEAAVKALIEAALQTLRDSITALQQQDNTDDGRIKAILDQIAALDQKIRDLPPAGLSEAEVQILVDGMLQILRDNIAALQQQDTTDDGRIKSILDQIALLDQKIKDLPPAGLSETEVQTLVDGMLQTLRDNIAALQQQDIADDGRINDALAQITALQTKVDANFNLTAADIQLIRDELLQIGQDLTLLKNQGSDHETRLQQIEAIKAALDQLLQNPPLTVEQIQALVQAALATILTDIAQLKQQDISDNGRFLKIEADITLILEKLKDLPPGGGGSGISAQEMRDYVQLILEPIRTELGELRSFRDSTILALTALQQDVAALKLALTQQPPQTWVEEAVKAALAAALAQLMPLITALQTENITQQGLVEGLRSELNALKLTVENWPPGPTEEQVRRWITTILEIFKASLDTKFTGLTTDITNLQNQITVLQTDIKNVPTAEQIKVLVLAALEAWKGEIELKIGNLQQQYLLLVEEDKTLHLAINNLKIEIEGRLSGIQTELTEVKSSIGGLKTWQTEVQGKLPDLEKCCTDGNASIEGLKTWQTEVQGKLPDLEKCCTDGKTSIHTLEEDVENIKKELEHSDSSSVGIRLARLCLLGRGIVGGLEVISRENDLIHVSAGVGITPHGDLLLESQDRIFNYYREYENTENYPYFFKGNIPVPVWELLEVQQGSPVPANARALTAQIRRGLDQRFIEDKVLLLYTHEEQLHYLVIRRDDLVRQSGMEETLRNLLAQRSDTDYIYSESFNLDDNTPSEDDLCRAFNPVLSLPEIPLFRFGFRPDDECLPADLDHPDFPNITTFQDIYNTWLPIINEALRQVDAAAQQLLDLYHPTLFPQVDVREFKSQLDMLLEKWEVFQDYNSDEASPLLLGTKFYIQYFYDWARDLIGAYHELRAELQVLMVDLCILTPEQLAQQYRHLQLGPAERPVQNGLAAPLRDEFRQPPIYNGNAARLETSRLYFRRLFVLIRDFYLPDYLGANALLDPYCRAGGKEDLEINKPDFSKIKITPSRSLGRPLSEQSIPFYYPVHSGGDSPHRYWSYRRAKTRTEDRLLCYHATDEEDLDSYSNLPEVVRPLYYTLDAYDFYRVEGHIGRLAGDTADTDVNGVINLIRHYVRKYNLDFDVIDRSIDDLIIEYPSDFGIDDQGGIISIPPKLYAYQDGLLGMEHIGGVPKGGTLVLVTAAADPDDTNNIKIVADFSLPYRCCDKQEEE